MKKKLLIALTSVWVMGCLIPQRLKMPVQGATASDYNKDSFWYYPWGRSVTHKGVDIFANKGTPIHSSTIGWVLFAGHLPVGGKVVLVLGPKWRVHYYAHLDRIDIGRGSMVIQSSVIGTVGDSGNAQGKAPHLHYSMLTLIPYPWRIDRDRQGWKKMFYLNPIDYISPE